MSQKDFLKEYCFDLAVEIIGSDLDMANNVADILYREFKALEEFGMIKEDYWKHFHQELLNL